MSAIDSLAEIREHLADEGDQRSWRGVRRRLEVLLYSRSGGRGANIVAAAAAAAAAVAVAVPVAVAAATVVVDGIAAHGTTKVKSLAIGGA